MVQLPLEVQPKLLRVIESAEFRRVGGTRPLQSGARIIAATKRDLKLEVERGKFREDLFFRLAVVPVDFLAKVSANTFEDIIGKKSGRFSFGNTISGKCDFIHSSGSNRLK